MGKIKQKREDLKLEIEKIKIKEIKIYENNAKEHPQWQIEQIKKSIVEFGFNDPIAVDEDNIIIEGHGRYYALKELGFEDVEIIKLKHLTEEQKRGYIITHNNLTMNTGFDEEILKFELTYLEKMDFDLSILGLEETEIEDLQEKETEYKEIVEDIDKIEEQENIVIKKGDFIELGKHRVLCGDSTNRYDVLKLLGGQKANLVFTDPPYGMKKEKVGVKNDNLNYDDLLEFNKKWVPISFEFLEENGSWYCWGTDEPLMDIYSNILKPKIIKNQITFRNLLTWDKSNVQGQNSDLTRMYATADEKCLFVMNGVQGSNNNSENYFEGWEPIRNYLNEEMEKCGGSKNWKKALNNQMGKHYFTKSQWVFPTKENYEKLQAFGKEYDAFEKDYSILKKDYYDSRAYFNNTHDNMNNVWHFDRLTTGQEKDDTGGHATPKPIALCSRAIKSSSREKEIVLYLFGGSGSTMMACEQLNRKSYLMEFEPKWVQTIVERYVKFTRNSKIKINNIAVDWQGYKQNE